MWSGVDELLGAHGVLEPVSTLLFLTRTLGALSKRAIKPSTDLCTSLLLTRTLGAFSKRAIKPSTALRRHLPIGQSLYLSLLLSVDAPRTNT